MAFEHDEENIKPDNSIVARIEKVMVNLVSKDSGAKKESAHEFTHLVSLLRKVDKKRMTPIMEQFLDCEKGGLCTSTQTDLKSVYRYVSCYLFRFHCVVTLRMVDPLYCIQPPIGNPTPIPWSS